MQISTCTCYQRRSFLRCLSASTLVLAALVFIAVRAHSFALLGPYTDWMMQTNGYRQLGDIGGPMDIDEGYRWNVPILTYGFDEAFLEYFGSNGVAAVESAIKILNDLPPASHLVTSNYPYLSEAINYVANAKGLYDLKSVALAALVEQMGLAPPSRYVFAFRRWNPALVGTGGIDWPDGTIPYYVVQRNFDPETLVASPYVNYTLYAGAYTQWGIVPIQVDPFAFQVAVAEYVSPRFLNSTAAAPGLFLTGLTFDDVGGLRFLLSSNNVNYEVLLPDVRGAGSNTEAYTDGAWRPGVDKITFARQRYDGSGKAIPFRYRFTDTFLSSGIPVHQHLKRVVGQPDFLFSATDPCADCRYVQLYHSTGTDNWRNLGAQNGRPTNAGPGIIRPPVKIAFEKLGSIVYVYDSNDFSVYVADQRIGSFDGSTNSPVAFPTGPGRTDNGLSVLFRLRNGSEVAMNGSDVVMQHKWQLPVPFGGVALLEVSTNLSNWEILASLTNNGAVCQWQHFGINYPQRFFRAVAE